MSNQYIQYETKEIGLKLRYDPLYKAVLKQLETKHHDMALHKLACQNEECTAIGVMFFYGDNQVGNSIGCEGFVCCERCGFDTAVCNNHVSDFIKIHIDDSYSQYWCSEACKNKEP